MKTLLFFTTTLMCLTAGASETGRDSEGVPKVDLHGTIVVVKPASNDGGFRMMEQWARMIDVDGKRIPIKEFYLTFCMGKKTNETCARAMTIMRVDSGSGPGPLPKGL